MAATGTAAAALSTPDLTNTLWAAAKMRWQVSDDWKDALAAAVAARLQQLEPYQLAFLFGSLQSLQHRFAPGWVDALLAEAQAQLPASSPADISLLLTTVARMQYITGAWAVPAQAAPLPGCCCGSCYMGLSCLDHAVMTACHYSGHSAAVSAMDTGQESSA